VPSPRPSGTFDCKVLFYQNLSLDITECRNCRCDRVFLLFLSMELERNRIQKVEAHAVQPFSMVDDDSPLHGVSTEQLEDFSGMPMVGWLDPQTEEKFIRRVDEGIVDRATGLPARQYRYHFVDETIWTHPGSETRVLSTTPRQEVYLIDLELY